METIRIFLWKHWKCFRYSWIKNVFMIVVPILIAWFHIYVASGHSRSTQVVFDPINEVSFVVYYLYCCCCCFPMKLRMYRFISQRTTYNIFRFLYAMRMRMNGKVLHPTHTCVNKLLTSRFYVCLKSSLTFCIVFHSVEVFMHLISPLFNARQKCLISSSKVERKHKLFKR